MRPRLRPGPRVLENGGEQDAPGPARAGAWRARSRYELAAVAGQGGYVMRLIYGRAALTPGKGDVRAGL